MPILMSLKQAAVIAFNEVYPEDGNASGFVYSDLLNKFAALIGLPNRKVGPNQPQTTSMLIRDFAGLQYNVSTAKKWLNRILAPFVFTFNIFLFAFQFALNMVKVLTEFLPLLLSQFLLIQSESINRSDQKEKAERGKINYLSLALLFLGLAFHGVYFIGRSITSPIEGVKKAWSYGYGYSSESNRLWRILQGLFFASLSIACTTLAYVILFPLVVKPLVGTAANFLAAHLPQAITAAFTTLIQNAALFINPASTVVGNFILQHAPQLILNFLGLMQVSVELIGLSALVGLAVTVIGAPISAIVDVIKTHWHKPAERQDSQFQEDALLDLVPVIPVGLTAKLSRIFLEQAEDMKAPDSGMSLARIDPQPAFFEKAPVPDRMRIDHGQGTIAYDSEDESAHEFRV